MLQQAAVRWVRSQRQVYNLHSSRYARTWPVVHTEYRATSCEYDVLCTICNLYTPYCFCWQYVRNIVYISIQYIYIYMSLNLAQCTRVQYSIVQYSIV